MTVHEEHGHAHGGVRSEEDRISTGRIVAVGVASLLLFIVSGLAVLWYFETTRAARPGPPISVEVGRSKIGLVEQQLFERAARGERDRAARLERLGGYGWVDRGAGVAHVPIDLAMELVAKGTRARPGAPPRDSRVPGGQP
jgi:hypothetical protein